MRRCSGEQFAAHLARHVREPEVAALETEGELCVIETEQVQNGRVQIRPPHSPTPVRVLTVSGAAGAKAISFQSVSRTLVGGWFELIIPTALLGDSKEIAIEWIDFYR
jgi:hypothetical protein